jgi:transposase
MTAPSSCRSSTASASREPAGEDARGDASTASSPTRATAIRAADGGCASGRFPIPSPSGATSGRNVVERCINRLKQWRGLATRYEKCAVNYRAMLVLASIVLWLQL